MTSLRVVNFGYNNLNGDLPNEFFNQLPQLENFNLADNQFEGRIPRSIGNCTSLISFVLASNFFTGMFHIYFIYYSKISFVSSFVAKP